jgi:hypothetical protein
MALTIFMKMLFKAVRNLMIRNAERNIPIVMKANTRDAIRKNLFDKWGKT